MPPWMYRAGLGLSAAGAIASLLIVGPSLWLSWMTLGAVLVLAVEHWVTSS